MRRSIPLFAAILAVLAAAPARAQTDPNGDICAASDGSAQSPEQRIAACSALIEATKDTPQQQAAAYTNRGAAYYYVNKMPLALSDFSRAVALDPKNSRAFRERGNSYRTVGRIDLALADANEAIRLDPSDAVAFDNRGNVFNNNRQFDRGIDDYNEAVRLDPKFAQAFMDRGVAHYFKKEFESAIRDYDEAIKLNPNRSRAYTNRGAAYKGLGRNDRAIADESEAIRLDPLVPEYYDNRGLSYADNGDFDRAITDYNEAIRLSPAANFLTNRGDAYNQKHDCDRAIKLNPGFVLAYNNRGVTFRAKGDLERAIADFEQALRVDPRMDSAAENLADARQLRDRRDGNAQRMLPSFDCGSARRAVEKAICSDPDLSRLDRQTDDAYKAALIRLKGAGLARVREEQHDFNAERNRAFGRPEYQLKRELERRLAVLRAMGGGN
jgi:tetratricopeptide (TPR) repeat protein